MITIVCGEDIVASRNYLQSLLQDYKKKGYIVSYIVPQDLTTLTTSEPSTSLFGEPTIYVVENLNKVIGRKSTSNTMLKTLDALSKKKEIELLTWERDLGKRELKYADLGKVKEFKPSASVFTFIDSCYPGNKDTFYKLLGTVVTPTQEMFAYVMLQRQMRNVLTAAIGGELAGLPPWQKGNIYSQAKRWNKDKLLDFYEKLLNIEVSLKLGKNVYGIKKSIELLSCYYL